MNLREFFSEALAAPGRQYRPCFLADQEAEIETFDVEETYLQLGLSQMFLKQSRELYRTRYPMVHALMRFSGLEGPVEVNQLITPLAAGQKGTSGLDRVISLNQTLLGPVLYRGGSLELLIGLYSAPADDWAQRLIDLAQGISALALQGPLATALAVAQPIKESVEGLLGMNGIDLKLGLNSELRPQEWLLPGHLALIAAPAAELAGIEFFVDDGALYTRQGPYETHDFMLLSIEAYRQRSDWQRLGLGGPWNRLIDTAARSESKDAVADMYLQFSGSVMSSPDLSWIDRQAICTLAQERVVEIRKSRSTDFLADVRAGGEETLKPLLEIGPDDLRRAAPQTRLAASSLLATDWL